MSGNKSKIIAFNYFGGKFTWIEYLYRYFPEGFTHLVDLFAGSMVVSINYPGKVIKTANEINSDITNFFEVLRNHEDDLIRLLLLTPCSLQEYDNCREYSDDNIEQARRFYVRVRQSFFGLGCPKAFFYCDPPYPVESRGGKSKGKDYKFDFTDDDHRQLAARLHRIEGKAMISGYDCNLMNELYGDWHKVKFPIKRNNIRSNIVNGSGTIMQETIWMNYVPTNYQKLF